MNVVDEKNLKAAFDTTELKKVFEFQDDKTCITFQPTENQKDDVVNSVIPKPTIIQFSFFFIE